MEFLVKGSPVVTWMAEDAHNEPVMGVERCQAIVGRVSWPQFTAFDEVLQKAGFRAGGESPGVLELVAWKIKWLLSSNQ